jgi:hypothetical protein
VAAVHAELDALLDGAEDLKMVKAAKHAVLFGADAKDVAPLLPPPEVGSRPSELLPRLQVRLCGDRFPPTGDLGYRGIGCAVGLGCRFTV